MLSIVEMLQFKKRIYRETLALGQSQRREIKASDRGNLSKHFLVIPSECPQSRLVYGKNGHRSYKEAAHLLYWRYIKWESKFAIDIEMETRTELTDLIEHKAKWLANTDYDDPLLL